MPAEESLILLREEADVVLGWDLDNGGDVKVPRGCCVFEGSLVEDDSSDGSLGGDARVLP
jgi:hypothetical protein